MKTEKPNKALLAVAGVIACVTWTFLAFALKDRRAFCKYLCPNAAILRVTSRFSGSVLV